MIFRKISLIFHVCSRKFVTNIQPGMKYLNVAEKNDAAKNIAALLSRGSSLRREGLSPYNKIYEFNVQVLGQQSCMVMTSVSGHLLNYEFVQTYKNWQSCNPVSLFDAPIIKGCSQDYIKIKKTLEREIRSCQGLIIWTDCDREGENIGFEIIKVCTDVKPNLIVYRAKFSEITTTSIFRALNTLGQPNKNVSDAVNVRQELDLRTGAAFTRLQTLRFQKVFPGQLADKLISYGSCQFPTLGFVVERYQAIEDFVSEPFWKIKMNHKIKDLTVDFNWKRERLFNKTAVEGILDICKENPMATVEFVESKPKSKWRPLPLDTVELEKTVSKKLRINAKDTMKIAEKLYTQGYISYPRTETNIFPKELNLVPLIQQQIHDHRWGTFAQGVLDDGGPNPRQGKKSDQAHPPIHPIKYVNNLAGNDQKIYEYIVRHFLACVSKDAVGHETIVTVDIANEKFIAKGLLVLERNYLEVFIYDKWNVKEIHEYQNGQTFMPTVLDLAEGNTSPPKLLTEADLIALMDKNGIGTDATHADHIDTIKSRDYVGLVENIYFVPGTLGMGLVEGYNNVGLDVSLAKPSLRSQFERDLQLICEGRKSADLVRQEQIEKYKAVFITVMDKIAILDRSLGARLQDQPLPVDMGQVINTREHKPVLKCPKCGKDMIIRDRKNGNGKYMSCMGFPECKNAVWFPRSVETAQVLEESCENCGPNNKKLKVKFHQNPFPGEPNPNTLCVGGCDLTVLETLNIKLETVCRLNGANMISSRPSTSTNANSTLILPSQGTLNNWIGSERNENPAPASTSSSISSTNGGISRTTFNSGQTSNNNRNGSLGDNTRSAPGRSFLNSNVRVTNTTTGSTLPLRNNNSSRGSTVNDTILCSCNKEAVLLTVKKVGPNTGKQFYKCEIGTGAGGCDFFMWATPDSATRTPPSRNTQAQPSTSTSLFSGEITCNCPSPASLRVVTKVGPNTGRQFYCCPKPIGEGCSFFQWADEGNPSRFNGGGGGGDDDDDDDNNDQGHNPGWGNSTGWTSQRGSTSKWRGGGRKKNQWKAKSKRKTKTIGKPSFRNQIPSTSGKGIKKCSNCGIPGHMKNKCTKK